MKTDCQHIVFSLSIDEENSSTTHLLAGGDLTQLVANWLCSGSFFYIKARLPSSSFCI